MLRVLTLSSLFPDAARPQFGVFVERQAAALAALPDVAVTVVAPVGVAPGLGWLPRYRARAGLPEHEQWHGLAVYRPRFAAWPGTAGRFHAASLARAVRPVLDRLAGQFDVIDASFFFPDGPAAIALGRRYGVPVSIKARGADIHHWGRARATRGQVRRAGQAADGLLAVSAALAEDMAALGMPGARVHHTGLDQRMFHPGAGAPDGAGPMVISLGALIPRKRHDVVIAAVARLPGVRLTVVGEGPERARLAALAARLGVAERVRFAGGVAHAALPALLAGADVMALASESEGLANAWVEALACGTPLVIAPAGGAAEVVRGPAAGRIVARTPEAFAEAIAGLLADSPARDAVRAAVSGFSWEATAQALRDHLAGLVAAQPNRG